MVIFEFMGPLRAHIQNGRVVVDDPVDLPDGTELQLAVLEDTDDLDDVDRARLHAAIEAAQAELDDGHGIPADQVLAELRSSRRS